MIITLINLAIVFTIIAGVAYAYNQVARHYYKNFAKKHPGHNELFWGPEQWRNKWKNGDKSQGERFWGSSRWFVVFTDAHHLTMWVYTLCWWLAATAITMATLGIFKPIWYLPLVYWGVGTVLIYMLKGAIFESIHSKYE